MSIMLWGLCCWIGRGGTYRFTVVSRHLNVCRVRPRLYQSLFTQYFQQFGADRFQILRYGEHRQDRELLNFSWLWLHFQGHRGSLCFKNNFVYSIFLAVFCRWLSHFSDFEWPQTRPWIDYFFVTLAQVQGHRGSLCFNIYFVFAIFPEVFHQWLSNSHTCIW